MTAAATKPHTMLPDVGSFWREPFREDQPKRWRGVYFVAACNDKNVLLVYLTPGGGRTTGTIEWASREGFAHRALAPGGAPAGVRDDPDYTKYEQVEIDDEIRTEYQRVLDEGGVKRWPHWTTVSEKELEAAKELLAKVMQ